MSDDDSWRRDAKIWRSRRRFLFIDKERGVAVSVVKRPFDGEFEGALVSSKGTTIVSDSRRMSDAIFEAGRAYERSLSSPSTSPSVAAQEWPLELHAESN
jgi:hypothetical protein